jgi:hypothetical protein
VAIAATITAVKVAGTILLALQQLGLPLTLVYAGVYAVGIAIAHAREGWFVVGAGRNGAEYGMLLIVARARGRAAHSRQPRPADRPLLGVAGRACGISVPYQKRWVVLLCHVASVVVAVA